MTTFLVQGPPTEGHDQYAGEYFVLLILVPSWGGR